MLVSTEKIVACIAADASAPAIIQEAARMAHALNAAWITLYVETPRLARLPLATRERVLANLQWASERGAETYTLGSVDVAETILEFARSRGATLIFVGKPSRAAWLRRFRGSMVDTLVSQARGVGIHIVNIEVDASGLPVNSSSATLTSGKARSHRWLRYSGALVLILASSAISLLLEPLLPGASIMTLYLLAALLAGLYLGRGPAAFMAIGGGLAFNFLFTSPRFTLHIYQLADIVNFGALLAVSMVVAQLSAHARHQARVAVHREERAVSLGSFTAALLSAQTENDIAAVACNHIGRAFEAEVDLWLRDDACLPDSIRCVSSAHLDADRTAVLRAMENGMPAAPGTAAQSASLHYMPVIGAYHAIGVLVMRPRSWKRLLLPEPRKALQSYAHQLALAIERVQLLQQKKIAELAMRAEDLRNDLLAGLSHDLRTPLASILGSSSALVESENALSEASRNELIATIHEESLRMTRLVTNLLDMARLTQGFSSLKRDWIPIEELIGSVRNRLAPMLRDRVVTVKMSPELPLAYIDGLLLEQVLQNLLENAVKYSPSGSPIDISTHAAVFEDRRQIKIVVADRGGGVPAHSKRQIFEKFHRAHQEGAQSGLGLGLALTKSIIYLHGGTVGVDDRVGGGSEFWLMLPLQEQPPSIDHGEPA